MLRAVRTGTHPGFQRLVFEFDGKLPEHRIEVVDRPPVRCGSGDVAELPGKAWLHVRFAPAYAHTEEGEPTVPRKVNGLNIICDFEAVVEWAMAVPSRTVFEVTRLDSPSRLVVDVR